MEKQAYTFRKDLRYIQTKDDRYTNERIVGWLEFLLNRLQFWRFKKYKNFNVLREKKLDKWMSSWE